MRYLTTLMLLLALTGVVAATNLDDLNPSLPADSYDVSTHAAYLRALHLAVRTFGLSEHDGAGMHMIPMGSKVEMLKTDEVNGRLFFVTDPPARMYIYRETCDCWSPVAVYDPNELDYFMYVSDYDPNGYGDRVEYSENLHDGTNTATATEVYEHLQMINGTDNPHGLEADDIDFTSGSNTVEDLVTVGAATGAALIPLGISGSFVNELASTASGDGASLVPFSVAAHALSGASLLDLFDTVDGGYDVTLLLDDVIMDAGPWSDIRFYGGTGNDTTDDTAAFQSASEYGAFVLVPAGDYYLDSSVEIETNNTWFVGVGVGKTIIHRNDAVGANWGALVFNKDAAGDVTGCGLANMTITSEAMATTGVGVTVGNTSTGAQVTFHNVEIDGADFLSHGLDLVYAYDSHFEDIDVKDCGIGIRLNSASSNNLANRNIHFDKGKLTGCTATGYGALTILWGENLTFRDINFQNNDTRAVAGALAASAETRSVLFDGCAFKENLAGAMTSKYQVGLQSAASMYYTKWVFQNCTFIDAVNNSNTNKHITLAGKMQAVMRGCYFDQPGTDENYMRVVGNIGTDCRFWSDDFDRTNWYVDPTAHVSGSGPGFVVNGKGRSESYIWTLASGTPTAIDGVAGDKVYTTGTGVTKGNPQGWVCKTSGSYDVLDTGAHCSTTATSPTFTVDTTYLTGHMIEIGDRLAFTSDATWSVTYPTVINVSVDGTTASVTMNSNAGSTNATDTAVKQDPVWEPIAEIPIYHTEPAVSVGAVTAGALVSDTFSVTGAVEGDFVTGAIEWSALGSADPEDFLFTWSAGAGTVRYVIYNGSGADITTELDGADFYVVVRKLGATVP